MALQPSNLLAVCTIFRTLLRYPRSMSHPFLPVLREALSTISEARLFHSERGYQGALAARITHLLGASSIWPGNPIVEEEYQKRAKDHGLRLRPDLIVHIPFERGTTRTRQEGNHAVIELKRRASRRLAFESFEKLLKICRVLHYPIGIFVNIGANEHYLSHYRGNDYGVLHAFAVTLVNDAPVVHE